jgi:DNA-binding GntR family transcriptional regulator
MTRVEGAKDRAYAFTKQRVLDATYAGGELLTEGEVAEALGMSRTPVREAFLRLESEGLLRLYPKRGALVVPVSAREVEAVMETRALVEQFAVAKAIERSADVTGAMREAIARQEEHAGAGDLDGFVAADREFHTVLVAAAGNDILMSFYDSLRDRQQRMGIAALRREPRRLGQILDEHRGLTDAIEAGDVEATLALLEEHLRGTLMLLRRG